MKKIISASFLAAFALTMLLPVTRQVNAASVNHSVLRTGRRALAGKRWRRATTRAACPCQEAVAAATTRAACPCREAVAAATRNSSPDRTASRRSIAHV